MEGRSLIVDFEVVGASISKLPQPKSLEELENSTEDDSFEDCSPWLELTHCDCNCTNFPVLGNVLVGSNSPDANAAYLGDEDSEKSYKEEQDIEHDGDVDHEQSDKREEEPVPLYIEYVSLRGSTFHEDCQRTLKKCRDKLFCAKKDITVRVLPEPSKIRDCNYYPSPF